MGEANFYYFTCLKLIFGKDNIDLKNGRAAHTPRNLERPQWMGYSNRYDAHVSRHDPFLLQRQIYHHLETHQGRDVLRSAAQSAERSWDSTLRYRAFLRWPVCSFRVMGLNAKALGLGAGYHHSAFRRSYQGCPQCRLFS